MDFQSDFNRVQNLLDTEDITNVDIIEEDVTPASERRREADLESLRKEPDTYAELQRQGNLRAESLSSNRPWNYNMDMDDDGSKINRGLETDFRLTGGVGMDDYMTAQNRTDQLDDMERDFFAIFSKAREYRKRVENMMEGGQSAEGGEKKKRTLSPVIRLMIDLSRKMNTSRKYPDIKGIHFMKISKMIVDEAKRRVGTNELNDQVKEEAMRLSDNPTEFVERYRREKAAGSVGESKEKKNERGNIRTSVDQEDRYPWRTSTNYPWRSNFRAVTSPSGASEAMGQSTRSTESRRKKERRSESSRTSKDEESQQGGNRNYDDDDNNDNDFDLTAQSRTERRFF